MHPYKNQDRVALHGCWHKMPPQSGKAWACTQSSYQYVLWKSRGIWLTGCFYLPQGYLACFHDPALPTMIQCFCNNIGVIASLTLIQESTIAQPNDTTTNDHDLFLEITATAACCQSISFQYLHIKGHQDANPHCQTSQFWNSTMWSAIGWQNSMLSPHSFQAPTWKIQSFPQLSHI